MKKNNTNTKFFSVKGLLAVLFIFVSVWFVGNHSQIFRPKADMIPITSSPGARFNVGYKIITTKYTLPNGTTKPLTFAVWYPTRSQAQFYNYNRSLLAPGGYVAQNAPVATTAGLSYPLIVLSHGAGGCGTIYVYLTSYLASHGYIVAAPDHQDAIACSIANESGLRQKSCTYTSSPTTGANNMCERPYDISAVISSMLNSNQDSASLFYRTINPSAIGAAGHSAGGLTVMQVSGLEPALYDPRVKASLMLAEDTGNYSAPSYAKINTVTMFQIGQYDTTAKITKIARDVPFLEARPGKFLALIPYAWHLAFDDTACLGYSTIEDCQKNNKRIKPMLIYSKSFFDAYLKNNMTALNRLTSTTDTKKQAKKGLLCFAYQLPNSPMKSSSCPQLKIN